MIRRFQVPEGRSLVLPVGLTEGPDHTGLKSGAIIDIDQKRIDGALCHRYIRNRLALGDLVELEYMAPEQPRPAPMAFAAPLGGTPSDPNPFEKE